jgi:hypothetical protein
VCRRRVRARTVEENGVTAALSEFTSTVWDFIRSDPGTVRRLNTPGNWATWQTTRQEASRSEIAPEPYVPGTERRSFRRRRWLAA